MYIRLRFDDEDDKSLERLGRLLQELYPGVFAHQKDPADLVQ